MIHSEETSDYTIIFSIKNAQNGQKGGRAKKKANTKTKTEKQPDKQNAARKIIFSDFKSRAKQNTIHKR